MISNQHKREEEKIQRSDESELSEQPPPFPTALKAKPRASVCGMSTRTGGKPPKLSVRPHLALPLLVSSKELSNLVQEAGVLLPPAQPERSLSGAARRRHLCSGGWGVCVCV